ncbi:hypothetical protein CHS0354_023727 [Potamilus streckersoni]|uniref:Uncharacterized protein n=1 Tax=Potamilus streckersoni TaxID=2493646 RepID=A0AAE0RYZ5_9BIVA|nr:hypothetical protein CHS0354_023727 [Potamilus streckersoni]
MNNPLSPEYREAIETQYRVRAYLIISPILAMLLIFSPFPSIDMGEAPKKLTLRLKSDAGISGSSAQMTPLEFELKSDLMTLENSLAGVINIDTELGIDERHYFGLGFGFLFDHYFSFDLSYKYAFAHKIPTFNNTGYFNFLGGGFMGYGFSLLSGGSQSGIVTQDDLTKRNFAVLKDQLTHSEWVSGMFAPYSVRNAEIEMEDTKELVSIRKANGFMAQCYAIGANSRTEVLSVEGANNVYEDSEYNVFLNLYAGPADNVSGIIIDYPKTLLKITSVKYYSESTKKYDTVTYVHTRLFSKYGNEHVFAKVVGGLKEGGTFIVGIKVMSNAYTYSAIVGEHENKMVFAAVGTSAKGVPRIIEPKVDYIEDVTGDSFQYLFRIVNKEANFNKVLLLNGKHKTKLAFAPEISKKFSTNISGSLSLMFRTLKTNTVIFSTWTGEPQDDYPIELEIGLDGKLRLFLGNSFSYYELTSTHYVATGRWNNVKVDFISEENLLKLYLNEELQDSLFTYNLHIQPGKVSYLGSRNGERLFFDGMIDDISLVISGRDANQATQTNERIDAKPKMHSENFEKAFDIFQNIRTAVIEKEYQKKASAEGFKLNAEINTLKLVTLAWELKDRITAKGEYFLIEKSTNGLSYYEIARLHASESENKYSYTDTDGLDTQQVVYYRVTQYQSSGSLRFSNNLKLGMGDTEAINILPNIPNPFSITTTLIYKMLRNSNVELIIYSAIGKEIVKVDLGYKVVLEWLKTKGYDFEDVGCFSDSATDYPDVAKLVAKRVSDKESDWGVLLCGSGVGVSIVANKLSGVRAALVFNPCIAKLARTHNDANIICLPARFMTDADVSESLNEWANSEFEGGRHLVRVNKIESK